MTGTWIPPLDRDPIESLDAKAIIAEFVVDATMPIPTPLIRFVAGIRRVAHLNRITEDAAMNLLLDEVATLTGVRGLPVG